MNPSIRITFLGDLQVVTTDSSQSLPPTQKSKSLLAFLAVHHQQSHNRERLTGMYWGDRPEKHARRSLSTALWHIRRCFAPIDPILNDGQGVRFAWPGDLRLDVDEFEMAVQAAELDALETAVTLYRGDFLDGFYDDWVINERYRLQNLYLTALAQLMHLYHTAVRPQQSLDAALTLLRHDPLREEAHRAAIRAYAQLGRRSDALRQFDHCRQLLNDELGLAPSPETAALLQAVREGQIKPVIVEQYSASSEHLPSFSHQSSTPGPYFTQLPLTEREMALAELTAAWAETRQGHGRFTFIQGEPGIGKSRLLNEFSAIVRQTGGQVLSGACYEFERRLPYQPFADALRQALALLSPTDREALPGWMRAELRRLLPDWEPDAPSLESTHPDTLFHAAAQFLARLGKAAPVLLLIDDLHWANEATLSLLHYLARHNGYVSLFILCAHRKTMSPALTDLRQSLAQAGLAQTLHLDRLSTEGVGALVSHLLPQAESLADFLFAETEGNPFFLVELLKSLQENGVLTRQDGRWQADMAQLTAFPLPGTIKTAVSQRLSRLSQEAQHLAWVAAVLGSAWQYDLLHAVWPEDEETMLAGLDDLLRANLLQEGEAWDYAFTHHKIQEAIYDGLPRHRRLHLHAQVGQVLLTMEDVQPAELARHLAQGASVDKSLAAPATTALCRAGEQAAAQFAYTDALAYFQRALDLKPETAVRRQILLAREAVYHAQGAREAQVRDLDELAALPSASEEMKNRIRLRRARFAEITGDFETAALRIGQVLATGTLIQQARAHILQGDIARQQTDYAAAVTAIKQALPHVTGQPAIHAQARLSLGTAYLALKQFETAAKEHRRGRDLYRLLADRRGEAYALNNLGAVRLEQGKYKEAVPIFEEARAMFVEIGDRRGEGLSSANLGMIGVRYGNNELAQRELERAGEIFVEVGDESSASHLKLVLGTMLFNQGRLAAAQRYTRQAVELAAQLGLRYTQGQALNNLGYLAMLSGRYREGQDFYQQSLMIKREIGDEPGECASLVNLAQVCRRQGNAAQALAHSRAAQAIASRLEDDDAVAESGCEAGFALLDLGQAGKAMAVFAEVLPLSTKMKAKATAGLAAAALARGKAATAVAHIAPVLPMLADDLPQNPEVFAFFEIGCRALTANGETAAAQRWQETAVALLEKQAALIEDVEIRRRFLEDVPENMRLTQLAGSS